MHVRRHGGFTLIEILVVVAIIAIISAMLMIRLQPGSSRSALKTEVDRFDVLLELATEQAIIQGQSIGVEIKERGYRFYIYDPLQLQWSSIDSDEVLRQRTLPGQFRLDLEMESQDIELPMADDDEETDLPQPQILLLSSGDITPCDVYFETDRGDLAFQLNIDPQGEREIIEHEFGL